MTKVYLDACIVVYIVENTAQRSAVMQLLNNFPNLLLYSSHLAMMECLVKPFRNGNQLLIESYRSFFRNIVCIRPEASNLEGVFDAAAQIRAFCRLPAPDALHLALANFGECDVFLTNDIQLQQRWMSHPIYPFPRRVDVI